MSNILQIIKDFCKKSLIDEILIFALLVALVETFAQNILVSSDNGSYMFFFGICLYFLVAYILQFSYHHFPLSKLNIIWSCISIILAIVLGHFLYKEPLTSKSILSGVLALSAIIVGTLPEFV
jgi:uncharacterized membrane protein HdeD (DUF308 family)